MVVLNRIYTRGGDAGETALGNGARVPKHSVRVGAYGTVDELNATIGLARLHASGELDAGLARAQNDLFDLGADLCTPDIENDATAKYPRLRVVAAQVARLEVEIDTLNARLTPLRSFVLPGGTAGAALLHVARTTTRRAERSAWAALDEYPETVSPLPAKYLNRLSDLLFILSRYANLKVGDVLWVPGSSREDS